MTATPAGASPALIVAADGRRWWRCPACRRILGELVGGRVVVKAGRRHIEIAGAPGVGQRCPECGCYSELGEAA